MSDWEEWQKLYAYGTIVIWPPDDVRQIVNHQRARYDPASNAICEAHISISDPLKRSLAREEWSQIEAITAVAVPISISYGPIKSFLPYPCIWYEIQPVEALLELRGLLHRTGLFNTNKTHSRNFIPHMTITEGLSGPDVDETLLENIRQDSGEGTFICQELVHIIPDDDFHFQVNRRLPFGTESPSLM